MRISKFEIAKRQLNTATEIYFKNGDIISVITLAGAAEEIFGRLSKKGNIKARLGVLYKNLTGLTDQKVILKNVSNEINYVKNHLKHANENDETIEFEDGEALAMLGRAFANLSLCVKLTDSNVQEILGEQLALNMEKIYKILNEV